MYNIDNPKSYKRCHKKQFEMWMCMPPYGTVVINRMEQYDLLCKLRTVIPELKSREFLTPEELFKIKNSNAQVYNFIVNNAYVINKTMNVVLCGTEGELWATTYAFACNQYQMYHNEGYYNIPNVIKTRAKLVNNQYLVGWCRVRTTKSYSNNQTMALFVPVRNQFSLRTSQGILQKGNQTGVSHGKGDFIVCECINGVANLQNRWIVNGLVFADTYSNRGWEDNITIAARPDIAPKPLFTVKDDFKFTENFVNRLEKLYNNWEFYTAQKQANSKNIAIRVKSGLVSGLEFGAILKIVESTCKYNLLFENSNVEGSISDFNSIEGLFTKLENIIISNNIYKKYYNSNLSFLKHTAKRHNLSALLSAVNTLELDDLVIRNLCIILVVFERYIKEHASCNWLITDYGCYEIDLQDSDTFLELYLQNETSGSQYRLSTYLCASRAHQIGFVGFSDDENSEYFDSPYECNLLEMSKADAAYKIFCEAIDFMKQSGVSFKVSDELLELCRLMKSYFDEDSIRFVQSLTFFKDSFIRCCISLVKSCRIVAKKVNLKNRLAINKYIGQSDTGVCIFGVIFYCDGCNIENLERVVVSIYSDHSCADFNGLRKDSDVEFNRSFSSSFVSSDEIMEFMFKAADSDEPSGKTPYQDETDGLDLSMIVIYDDELENRLIALKHGDVSSLVLYNDFTKQFLFREPATLLESTTGVYISEVEDSKLAKSYVNISMTDFYDSMVPFLDALFDKFAYRLVSSRRFSDIEIPNTVVNVDFEDKRTGYVYLSMTKWFSSEKVYFVLSESSLRCFEYSYPNKVTRETHGKIAGAKYNRIHYHNLLIRLGAFSHINEFKKLKLLYMTLNEEVFNDFARHDLIVMAMGYAHYTKIDNANCSAYFSDRRDGGIICINAKYSGLQFEINKRTICTLVHEMCHECSAVKYGDIEEAEGEDGATLYGISEETYGIQVYYHGKKFNEFVEIAAQRNKYGLTHDDIFSYGVGHSALRSDYSYNKLIDNYILTVSEKNVFNLGQEYRSIENLYGESVYCRRCGEFNCVCEDTDFITVKAGEYLGVCIECGKSYIFNDSNVFEDKNINLSYFDSIDRVGAVAIRKCGCGGRLVPRIPTRGSNIEYIKCYMKDFKYCQRLKKHIIHYVDTVIDKHNKYFQSSMGCELRVSVGRMPFIEFDLVGDCFKEMYKLFIAHSDSGKTVGRLYRDYGIEAKGYLIHTFMLKSDKDISKFLDYLITYIRRDSREIISF